MGIAIMPAGMWVQLWFPCSWEFENYCNNNFLIVLWWSQRIRWFPLHEPDLCPLLKRSKHIYARFEVLTIVTMNIAMFWDVMLKCTGSVQTPAVSLFYCEDGMWEDPHRSLSVSTTIHDVTSETTIFFLVFSLWSRSH
jgi:hypothetical protein